MYDEIRKKPDGMTTDDIGDSMHVVGERISQIEFRAHLKLAAVGLISAHMDALLPTLPAGIQVDGMFAHNEHRLPNEGFVTIHYTIDTKVAEKAKRTGAVSVQRRKKGKR